MNMKVRLLLIGFIATLMGPLFAETQTANGTISDVIVYRGRALVTRTIELQTAAGDIELLIENLPKCILPESLYAQAADGIQVLSVRYRVKEIEKDMRAEVRAIDEQIEVTEKDLYQTKRDNDLAHHTGQRFAKMWEFGFEGASVSLDRAAFSSETMKDFTSYLSEKGEFWHNRAVELEQKIKDLEKQLAKLNVEKAKLAKQHKRSIRQVLVYLHVPNGSKQKTIQLSYLVDGANWSPQYNLKSVPDKKNVHVEYNAVVHQSSGEDWTNAQLALSTAVPALIATPPALDSMEIGLMSAEAKHRDKIIVSNEMQTQQQGMPGMAQQGDFYAYGDQTEKFGRLVQSRRSNISKGVKAQQELNTIAISNQMIEFEADKRLLQQLKEKAVAIRRAEGVSVMYRLPGKLTLPSKSDQQLVTIAVIDCPAAFTFVAAPLLTDYVYLQGDLTNTSNTILLPGPADTFRNGEFVGKADMKLVTIGQTFTTGFGVDSQIQVTREFKDKKIETLWGNRVDDHQYRIKIDNYKDTAVALRLMDRLPWTENKELGIELTANFHPLSTDAEYVRTQKGKGILRWDMKLNPNTSGQKATVVNYSFSMKYDNDMAIRNIN